MPLPETYEIHPRKDKRGADLISDVLPFGRLCSTASRRPLPTQSDTRSIAAVHMMLRFAFTMMLATLRIRRSASSTSRTQATAKSALIIYDRFASR